MLPGQPVMLRPVLKLRQIEAQLKSLRQYISLQTMRSRQSPICHVMNA